MKKTVLMVLAVGLTALGSVANAASIGLNLGTDQGGSLGAGDSAGVVAQANWNNKSGGSGSANNLVNNSGVGTTAGVSWTCTAGITWRVGNNGTSTANHKLMYGYIDPSSTGGSATVTLSGIPYSKYDLYVYFNSDNGPGRTGYVTDGTTSYYFSNVGDSAFPGFLQTTSTSSSSNPTANYA